MVLWFYHILSGYRMFYNALIAMIVGAAFTSTFPPIQFWRLLYWLPCRCSPACFVPFTPDGSEFAFTHFPITIESVSLFQSAILTKRSNSLLAVHVLLTQQHAFRFYLHLPQIEEVTDAYFCRRMCQSKIEWEAKYRSINGLQHCCL